MTPVAISILFILVFLDLLIAFFSIFSVEKDVKKLKVRLDKLEQEMYYKSLSFVQELA